MKVTIGFSRPKKFAIISKLIRIYQGNTEFSHAFLSFDAESLERTLVYEASHFYVHFIERKNFENKNLITDEFTIEVTPEEKKALLQFCIDNCQKSYGIKTLFGILFNIPEWKDGNEEFICSELVAKAFKISNDDYITPKQLYDIVKAKHG